MNGEENEIIHRWQNQQSIRSIARELDLSRWKVTRIVQQYIRNRGPAAAGESDIPPPTLGRAKQHRRSKLDAFELQIAQLLERYPSITAWRVFEELKRSGFDGGYSIVRDRVKQLRKGPSQPLIVRFETSPGAQAQMDWATYDIHFTQEGRRRVNLFSYLLGYSRRQYIYFTERQDFDTTIRQHIKAFEHLGGVAAVCLYDNMKVVVTRWEDAQPIYNTRFLAFATHYGYKPWACQIRRPQTKGKVERPFHYIENNLLNGREFRSLEHLNDVARWWLAQVADVRTHGTTKRTPVELHAEELPRLLPLPALQFDTAQVVYRVVDTDGTIVFASNHYSVPWRLVGEQLPVRITEDELIVYDRSLSEVARHVLFQGLCGARRLDPRHAPPQDHEAQMERLRERFAELGEIGIRYLAGLESKSRYIKHHARKVLGLLQAYTKSDVLAAMQRAVQYHAYSFSSLERILAHQATPKPSWQQLAESDQEALNKLAQSEPIGPRHSQEYQDLLYGTQAVKEDDHEATEQNISYQDSGETDSIHNPPVNPRASGDIEDPPV